MSFWECEKCGGVPGVTNCCTDKAMTHTTHADVERAAFIQWRMNEVRADEMSAAHVWDNNYLEARAWKASAARRAQVVPVRYVPVTASMGTVQRATEDGWNECVAAMLTAAPQPPEAAPVQMPEPAFRLKYKNGAYYVNKPNIDDVDCYTDHQVRQLLAAHGVK